MTFSKSKTQTLRWTVGVAAILLSTTLWAGPYTSFVIDNKSGCKLTLAHEEAHQMRTWSPVKTVAAQSKVEFNVEFDDGTFTDTYKDYASVLYEANCPLTGVRDEFSIHFTNEGHPKAVVSLSSFNGGITLQPRDGEIPWGEEAKTRLTVTDGYAPPKTELNPIPSLSTWFSGYGVAHLRLF